MSLASHKVFPSTEKAASTLGKKLCSFAINYLRTSLNLYIPGALTEKYEKRWTYKQLKKYLQFYCQEGGAKNETLAWNGTITETGNLLTISKDATCPYIFKVRNKSTHLMCCKLLTVNTRMFWLTFTTIRMSMKSFRSWLAY